MAGVVQSFREMPVLIGKRKSIVGILCEPQQSAATRGRSAVVMLNAGIIHRVGPNRMHVQLARAFARSGFTTLRFDMSGIGDSAARDDALPPLEAALADVRDALDWLTSQKQISRVVLMGLCAGADHSLLYSDSDPRVVGMMLIDPSVPRTRKYWLNSYGSRLSRLVRKSPGEAMESLANLWRRNLGAGNGGNGDAGTVGVAEDAAGGPEPDLSDDELHAMLAPHLKACVSKGVPILAILTGGVPQQHNYREQMLDAFPEIAFGQLLQLEFLGQCDHAVTREADLAAVRQILLGWLETALPGNGVAREECPTVS